MTDKYRAYAQTLKDLTAQEVLAFAIQSEEEDGRIYADLAQRIRKDYPATAQSLQAMRDEEDGHRHRLINLYRERFGEHNVMSFANKLLECSVDIERIPENDHIDN
jgi:rubrerythrin